MTTYLCRSHDGDSIRAYSTNTAVRFEIYAEHRFVDSVELSIIDARAFAAEIVKLVDEMEGATTVQTTLPNVMSEFDQRLSDIEAHLAQLQYEFVELKRKLGNVMAYMGFPKPAPRA